jgi:tetratricopeptide (TPR) repeat protein
LDVGKNRAYAPKQVETEELGGDAARRQLELVLASAEFVRNDRQSQFLRFLVERHLEGRDHELKESVVAVEVFGRDPGYDPKIDGIVRTEAMRLRARLGRYYAAEGSRDPLVIELPKGGYRPVLRQRATAPSAVTPRFGRMTWIAAAVIVATVLGFAAWSWPKLAAGPASGRQTQSNLEAYNLYMRGRHTMASFPTRDRPIARIALEYFEQAIRKDANFALAYAGIADTWLAVDENVIQPDAYPQAKAAAERAVALDPMLSEAHSALAGTRAREYNWIDAERGFRRATELDPNNALAHLEFGLVLVLQGRFDQGLGESRRGVELDPISPYVNTEHAHTLLLARRYTDAIAQLRTAIALDPSRTRPFNLLARALYLDGQVAESNTLIDDNIRRGASPDWAACAAVHAGQPTKAAALLQEQLKAAVPARRLATTYACLGEVESMLDHLERALAEDQAGLPQIVQAPELASMQSNPRFAMLRKRMNLAP